MLQANSVTDLDMMQRCLALAKFSTSEGEYPFAAVIASNGVFASQPTG
jgi:tRNA(Arg) A34 adenosine deaminase TadA